MGLPQFYSVKFRSSGLMGTLAVLGYVAEFLAIARMP
jgi:hypothetical protein